MSSPRTWLWLGGVSALLALSACSDSTSPGGSELSAAEANDAGLAQSDEVGSLTDALAFDDVSDGVAASNAAADGLSLSLAGPPHAGCATISSLVDSDGDGTPDNAAFTYALPACHFAAFDGGTLNLTGVITVTDPTPDAPGLSRSAQLTDFTYDFAGENGRAFTSVRNGTRQRSGSSASLTLNNNVTVNRTVLGHPTATLVHTLQAVFTPASGEQIMLGEPLPDGSIVVSGSLTWSRSGRSHTFAVTTVTPLQYDASCPGPRRERISAGEIQWTLPGGRAIVTTWTGCGVPPTHQLIEPTA